MAKDLLKYKVIVSQDTANYKDAPTEGIRRILEHVTNEKIPRGSVLQTDKIGTFTESTERLLLTILYLVTLSASIMFF